MRSENPSDRNTQDTAGLESLETRLMLNTAPVFATVVGDQHVIGGSSITIGINGYDADNDNLTLSAVSDVADVHPYVPVGNRYAKLSFTQNNSAKTPIGDIIVQLFDDRSPTAVNRFVTLATNHVNADKTLNPAGVPFYSNVVVHRVIPNFMIQTGDAAKGDGTGGSPLGTFADSFDPNLAFGGPGVLAMANSGANTNDSQFFITAQMTPWLTGKHMIFGQMITGQSVYNQIINLPTDANNRPTTPPLLKGVQVISDNHDGTITFTITNGFVGDAHITISLSDGVNPPTQQVITLRCLGNRPQVQYIANQFTQPGQTLNFHADVNPDDGGLPITVTVTTERGDITGTADSAGNISIPIPAGFTGMFRVSVGAYEQGYTDVSPNGVQLLVFSQYPDDALAKGSIPTNSGSVGSVLVGNRLYIAAVSSGLMIYDVSDAAHPTQLGVYSTMADYYGYGATYGLTVDGNYVYMADTFGGVTVVNVSDPANITLVGTADSQSQAEAAVATTIMHTAGGDYLFAANYQGGVTSYLINPDHTLTRKSVFLNLSSTATIAAAVDIVYKDGYLLVSDAGRGIIVLTADPNNMKFVAFVGTGQPWGLSLSGNLLYVADQAKGLITIDVANPAKPHTISTYKMITHPWQVKAYNQWAIVGDAAGTKFINVLDVKKPMLEYTFAGQQGGKAGIDGDRICLPMSSNGVAIIDGAPLTREFFIYSKGTILDSAGVPVTISVSNGVVKLITAASGAGNIEQFIIRNPNSHTNITVTTDGRRTHMGLITAAGVIGTFTALTTDFTDFRVNGIYNLKLGNSTGGLISINTAAVGANITVGIVTDLDISSQAPIKTLKAMKWLDSDGSVDITAPSIATLSITGNRTPAVQGDFSADMLLTGVGVAAGKNVLGGATIAGNLLGSAWTITGPMGNLTVKGNATDSTVTSTGMGNITVGIATNLDINSQGPIKMLKAMKWLDSDGSVDITATSIATLSITGNRTLAVQGDFTAGMLLTGVGVAAGKNVLGGATIAGNLLDSLWAITGPMGNLTVTGSTIDSTVSSTGKMGNIKVGASRSSNFLAGVTPPTGEHRPYSAGDFTSVAGIASFNVVGTTVLNDAGVLPPYLFADTCIAGTTVGAVNLLNVNFGDGSLPAQNKFGVFAKSAGTGKEITSVSEKNTITGIKHTWPPTSAFLPQGDLLIQVL